MALRVTQQMTVRSAIWQLNRRQSEVARMQEQLGTMRRINRPSDDPSGAARGLSLRTQLDRVASFQQNITLIRDRLDASASALQNVSDLLVSARQIVLSATSSAVSPSERQVMASQLEDILRSVVAAANTRHNDRYLFAGTAVTTQPFELVDAAAAAPVEYRGNDQVARHQVDFQSTIETNMPGSIVFEAGGAGDVFAVLSHARQLLLNTDELPEADQLEQLSAVLGELDRARENVLGATATLGSRSATLEQTASRLEDETLTMESMLSETEDADLVDLIAKFREQQSALEAALVAMADIIRPTLIDALG